MDAVLLLRISEAAREGGRWRLEGEGGYKGAGGGNMVPEGGAHCLMDGWMREGPLEATKKKDLLRGLPVAECRSCRGRGSELGWC